MADKAFSVQVLETIAALMTAAFGLIAALAWNGAIQWGVGELFPEAEGTGLFVYALIVTVLAVVATILIARSLAKMKTKMESSK